MDNIDWFAIIVMSVIISILIGATLNDIMVNPVTIEAKNQVCKELYGADYYFKDTGFGVELSFNCQRDIIINQIEPEEKPLVVKLN